MKISISAIMLVAASGAFAATPAEEACQSANIAAGKSSNDAFVYCVGTKFSAQFWSCVGSQVRNGKSMGESIAYCT